MKNRVAEAVSENVESDAAWHERRDAVRELGAALRELVGAAVSTEVDTDTLLRTAEQARQLAGPLTAATRTRTQRPSAEGEYSRDRLYNPAVGHGSPLAPPMSVEVVDGAVVGTCTLGLAYEGPPSYAHGGVSALLLDQILGHTVAAHGHPGMTVMLSLRYRRPVPLETPLRLAGWFTGEPGAARATISTVEEPDVVLVRAEGTFVTPNPAQVRRLFGDVSLFAEQPERVRE